MDDPIKFTCRTDLPLLSQTAIAHAQFETIHPFADGNGRTGRALIHAMLRGHCLTRNVTVPVRPAYLSIHAATLTASRRIAKAAAWRLADFLIRQPVVDATTAATELGVMSQNVLRAVAPLVEAGVLSEFTGFARNRMWQSNQVLTALDDFAAPAGRRSGA
jgi:Fic/DOC family